ncbi:MAG: sulfatase-like hydrolase/transferase [Lentisphaerae bacterium]|jgi:arylsulfatase A-like enzyme|nr:sulfatase-like hydrolase/transferase [Lentisphaerota bacterium]MBT4820946.1 sulfatase-like hydrolase/transferase [Lentisphaerota bacterium]MBT5612430.1 sulfatase-like hydrolase/transferase [Lentisphaerota bacterium]MBT7057136.1 sulfatase-like hydrolase/transferase [Lentisphaerota bacterium]MBT7847278.1 sulfatase-like hydrolase/transferase [Lentisphaerota bacterium]
MHSSVPPLAVSCQTPDRATVRRRPFHRSPRKRRRHGLFVGVLVFLSAGFLLAAERPNLVVIMTDDMGYADVGFNGCKDIPTPNIDRIAKSGVRCTSGYVGYSVCGPSRAAFMTGRYGQRFGFERNPQYRTQDPNMGLPKEERTIGEALKPVGYVSGVVGKWHLGAHKSNHPLNRGFDTFYGHLGGGHQYFPDLLTLKDSYAAKNESESYCTWILKNHTAVPPRKYLTEEFSEAAVEFVTANQKKPFFLFLSYNAPHGPLHATEKYLKRFPQLSGKRKTYAAMVSCVDDGVGELLNKLDELKLTENTIVFFLSDNGGPEKKNGSDNGALRGGKGSAYDGGFRVPFAVQWKGVIPAGRDFDKPVSSLDIMGTIADLAGVKADPVRPLDGVNLIPYLTGENDGTPHKAIYLRKFDGGVHTVRSGNYKMHRYRKRNSVVLYDLDKDIGEARNIASQHPETVQTLEALRVKWDSELVEPRFLGLIHTPEWQAKIKRKKEAEKRQKKRDKETR